MGELSKSIGEKGEDIVKFLFENVLNFNSLIENEAINYIRGAKHKITSSKANKSTHGIDGLISYKNPLEDNTLDIGIISSKYTTDEYPKSVGVFKNHLKDLAQTIECFNNSKFKNDINHSYVDVNKTEMIGILVWLSNKSDLEFDIKSSVGKILIDNDLIFDRIILLDNNRVNFLFESIYKTKEIFGQQNVDFVYHNSGLNTNSQQQNSYGKIFPLNYLYSDIIALRTQNDNKITLSIFINDSFDENEFVQLLHFAKSFDHLNAIDKIVLNFKKYDSIMNEKSIKEKLTHFPLYRLDENLEVKKFPIDFRK